METLSCHSNQISYPTGIKKHNFCRGQCPIQPCIGFILLKVSEKKNFEYFFKTLPFMWPRQTIKLSNLDKSRMKHGGLLNKHFCKKISNIPKDLAKIVNFHFSHYKPLETLSCHSNQSSYLTETKKKQNFCRWLCPKQVCQVSASSSIWFLRRSLYIFTTIDPFCHPDDQSNAPIWTKVI